MKTTFFTAFILLFTLIANAQDEKIKVLNIGIFHMGYTSDANSTEYDEASEKSKKEIAEVNKAIAKFKPTIILLEEEIELQEKLSKAYSDYLKNQEVKTPYSKSELQLMGFEIGRLAGVKRVYGIDHLIGYNYDMWELAKKENATKFFEMAKRMKELQNSVVTDPKKIGLKNMLKIMNTDEAYNFLINVNADMLMYANSKNGYEGADEASKFYQRNIRMFANINKIPMTKDDRVLIISGGTHASFFNKLMSRSMIYELEPITKYLN